MGFEFDSISLTTTSCVVTAFRKVLHAHILIGAVPWSGAQGRYNQFTEYTFNYNVDSTVQFNKDTEFTNLINE